MPSTHANRPQRRAVADWLSAAASHRQRTHEEWRKQGIALIQCGPLFSAVRIPADLVWSAAGSTDAETVARLLADTLRGGVFAQAAGRRYYALVEPDAGRHSRETDAEVLGAGTYLGVPAVDRTAAGTAAFWVVPVVRPGALCAARDVAELVAAGRAALVRSLSSGGDGGE
ncbi:hypothetical protein VSR01_28410 [Actinacidiphila sp. DG2A-62]|uniref:hypothetical protein n=1 Tax=Actinacidiphila sp. DG2A-62 TaxID=3108821 RepID=UPI002DBEC6ED|nr:hypothetical protein [Actinacidiphila sp. DG2A-62]MEC3997214.1 hypothetical protein [Actinacidiphila sp. DG2A-62]